MTNLAELQRRYEDAVAELETLTAALAATESEAAAASAELSVLTDGAAVLQAMAEERAARNRLALIRSRQAEAEQEKRRSSGELERARLDAIGGVVKQTRNEAGGAIVQTYRAVIEARDKIAEAQRAVGLYPVDSPLDLACKSLEDALSAVGGSVIPDTAHCVRVAFGEFVYTRRPVYWEPPAQSVARSSRGKRALGDVEKFALGYVRYPD